MADDAPKKSDIDFDELDKAVNSLMGKVAGETLEDSGKTKTLDINTTLDKGEKPVYNELSKVAEGIGSEMLVTDSEVELVEDLTKLPDEMALPVAQTKPAEAPTPQANTEPEKVHIELPKPADEETSAEPGKVEEAPAESPAEKPVDPPKPAVKRPSSGRFMDMVHPKADMTMPPLPNLVVPERKGVVTAATPAAAAIVAPPREELKEQTTPEPALSTPFIPDAKVEKRPLGAAAPTGGSIPIVSHDDDTSDDPKAADEEEVDDEVIETKAINSEQEKKHDDGSGDEQRALNASDFEKASSTEQELMKIEATETAEAVSVKTEAAQTIEKVESGDTENLKKVKKDEKLHGDVKLPDGAIFDTKDYHQAIGHPPKQKSGWGKVLLIVILIILAIAIAGGAYLMFGK
jgi:hypothetical protein